MTIPTEIPASQVAGDTWRWTLSLPDHVAPTWVATVYFTNSDGTFSSAAAASGVDHAFTIAAAVTATLKPGRYSWAVRAASAGISETANTGYMEVLPDPAGGKRDTRSKNRQLLDAVQCFLAGNATTAQASMTIRDRSISRWALADLLDWEEKLIARVAAEESAANGGRGRTIKVRISHAR